jgi:molecular chaperone HscB
MSGCWSCGAERGGASFCEACGKVQPVSLLSHFELLGVPRRMRLEVDKLEKAYRDKSRRVHPDRFGRAEPIERRLALEQTTHVNDAYRTLKDPQKRAEYLLSLEGVKVGKEESRTMDFEFLGEMLELQEAVESEKSAAVLESVKQRIAAKAAERMKALERYFDDGVGTKESAKSKLEELRYIRRLLERIDLRLEELHA